MANNPPSTETLERIHFDTLLADAEDSLATFAANTWSDRHDHDPGMTLMQAFAYAVSDAAYRHILPLRDLLTPEHIKDGDSIFPHDFGPQQALSSSPITPDDYRRALLDLHTSDFNTAGNTFFFRNVRLVPEPQEERYRYWYDPDTRLFTFHPATSAAAGKKKGRNANADASQHTASTEVVVKGGYTLLIELGRNVSQTSAEPVLEQFLKDHRNLCEAVRKIVWLKPTDVNVLVEVELEDDCRTPAQVMADIYTAVEDHLRPKATRQSAQEMAEQGMANDAIYQGPKLLHGWVAELPAELEYTTETVLNLSPLTRVIKNIAGVKGIRRLAFESTGGWEMQLAEQTYPRPWGASPFLVLAETTPSKQKVRLFKRGQQLLATESEIKAALSGEALIVEAPVTLPYGRWRKPAFYRNAGSRLPECYQLENVFPDEKQVQLRQFLLPFEQQMTNVCHLLSSLPFLLGFANRLPLDQSNQDGPPVWGGQWPFLRDAMVDEAANGTHAEYRSALEALVQQQRIDQDKELEIISYLLSYFGVTRSPHTLLDVDDVDYLKVQRGYLSQIAGLAYDRASIRVDRVSSFQKRIAARMGLAPELFEGDQEDLGKLPFYLVEHRSLLPAMPDSQYDEDQKPVGASVDNAASPKWLYLTMKDGVKLDVGAAIDLSLAQADGSGQKDILGLMVGSADGTKVGFSLEDNALLSASKNWEQIVEAQKTGGVTWKNANVWLQDMRYRLEYSADQSESGTGEGDELPAKRKRIEVFSLPPGMLVGDVIVVEFSASAKRAKEKSTAAESMFSAKVVSINIYNGTVVAELTSAAEGSAWPAASAVNSYIWYRNQSPADRFSFQIGIAADRRLLEGVAEPAITAAWIEQLIREEMPCHITPHIH